MARQPAQHRIPPRVVLEIRGGGDHGKAHGFKGALGPAHVAGGGDEQDALRFRREHAAEHCVLPGVTASSLKAEAPLWDAEALEYSCRGLRFRLRA